MKKKNPPCLYPTNFPFGFVSLLFSFDDKGDFSVCGIQEGQLQAGRDSLHFTTHIGILYAPYARCEIRLV